MTDKMSPKGRALRSMKIEIVMGVSGSGKSTVGKLLAQRLDWEFFDADDFHPPVNIEKMSRGIPLNDRDRQPWLERLHGAIENWRTNKQSVVLACSALKSRYRQILVGNDGDCIEWIYLKGTFERLSQRLRDRQHHFMTEALLQSQFDTLEEPENVLWLDISHSPEVLVGNILESLAIEPN